MTQECLIGIGSVTQALQARSVLSGHLIHTELTRLMPGQSTRGCAYGLTLHCSDLKLTQQVLTDNHIRHNLLEKQR